MTVSLPGSISKKDTTLPNPEMSNPSHSSGSLPFLGQRVGEAATLSSPPRFRRLGRRSGQEGVRAAPGAGGRRFVDGAREGFRPRGCVSEVGVQAGPRFPMSGDPEVDAYGVRGNLRVLPLCPETFVLSLAGGAGSRRVRV